MDMGAPELVVRLDHESPPLVQHLRTEGIKARLVRRATTIELERGFQGYRVPDLLRRQIDCRVADVRVQVAEVGGKAAGYGTVVCGLSGRMISPYALTKPPKPCGEHARFTGSKGLVTVTYMRTYDTWIIQRLLVKRNGDFAAVETKEVWTGDFDTIPSYVWDDFWPACAAAREKAKCPRCQHAHFALLG